MRRSRGFSLIEAMIVIVLITGVAMITLNLLNAEQRRQQRNAMVSEQANEMATITRAMEAYLESSDSLPPDLDTPFVLNPQDLVDAGLLPSDFAYRPMSGRITPTSPLGQEYLLIGVNTTDGYRGALLPTGDTSEGFMARAGLPGTPESLSEFGIAVMQRLKQDHLTAAGVTTAGALAINRDVSGFSFDLSMLLAAAPEDPTVISLAGFPEFKPVPPLQIEDGGGGDAGARKECFANITLDEPMSCPSGYELDYEYEMCSDPSGPARSYVTTGAGQVEIFRNQPTTANEDAGWPGFWEEVGARGDIEWVEAQNVSDTSPYCSGTALRADLFRAVNQVTGNTHEWQMLWCATTGRYHDLNQAQYPATTTSRGSTSMAVPPNSAIYRGTHAYTVMQRSPVGSGQTEPPSDAGLGAWGFLPEGFMYHQIYFRPPVTARYRVNGASYWNILNSWEIGSEVPNPSGWSRVAELQACVEGSSNEAPVYLMRAPLPAPYSGPFYAWSITGSGEPIMSSTGSETLRVNGSTVVSNHNCGTRRLSRTMGACPAAYSSTRRMTTEIVGSGGTRRVGICCK